MNSMHSSSLARRTGNVSGESENEGALSFCPNCSSSVKYDSLVVMLSVMLLSFV